MLSSDFWDAFVNETWERKPAVFRERIPRILSVEELFGGVQELFARLVESGGKADAAAPGKAVPNWRAWVDGREVQPPEWATFLPEGGSLEAYIATVKDRLGGAPFGLVINNFHWLVPGLLERCIEFTGPLVERVGIPAMDLESSVFISTYPTTPFGIHADVGNSVLTFPVMGTKRFLIWEPSFFDDDPLARYLRPGPENYEANAISLIARAGELIFWPGDWYHVAFDPTAAPNATFSIGLWRRLDVASVLGGWAGELLGRAQKEPCLAGFPAGEDLPAPLRASLETLEEAVKSGDLRRFVEEKWRGRARDAGYTRAPE